MSRLSSLQARVDQFVGRVVLSFFSLEMHENDAAFDAQVQAVVSLRALWGDTTTTELPEGTPVVYPAVTPVQRTQLHRPATSHRSLLGELAALNDAGRAAA